MNIDIDTQNLIETVTELSVTYGVKILLALAVFIIGQKIAKWVSKLCLKAMELKKLIQPLISSPKTLFTTACTPWL